MTEFILLSLILSACINGVYIVFNWDGMILQQVGLLLESELPEWFCKMWFTCATCMSGIYGLATYCVYYMGVYSFIGLVAFVAMTACVSTLINVFLECLKALKEIAEHDMGRTVKF